MSKQTVNVQVSELKELKKKIEELQARVDADCRINQDWRQYQNQNQFQTLTSHGTTLVPNPNLRVEPLSLIKSANQQWARKPKSAYDPKMDPNNVAFHKAALSNRLANDRNENSDESSSNPRKRHNSLTLGRPKKDPRHNDIRKNQSTAPQPDKDGSPTRTWSGIVNDSGLPVLGIPSSGWGPILLYNSFNTLATLGANDQNGLPAPGCVLGLQNQHSKGNDDFTDDFGDDDDDEEEDDEETVFGGPMDTEETLEHLPGDHGLGQNSKFLKKEYEGNLFMRMNQGWL